MGAGSNNFKVKCMDFNKTKKFYKITETRLEVDADVIKGITVQVSPSKYGKIISGECMIDLSMNQSVKWDINQ